MNNNCNRRVDCLFTAIAAAIIVAIVSAVLAYTAIITVTTVFYWVAFGIAAGFLVLARFQTQRNSCCEKIRWHLAGILGTIITALVLLAVDFAATSVLGAIITGLLLGFFALTITTAACLALCKADCEEY